MYDSNSDDGGCSNGGGSDSGGDGSVGSSEGGYGFVWCINWLDEFTFNSCWWWWWCLPNASVKTLFNSFIILSNKINK